MVRGNEANHEGMRNNFSFLLIHCTGHWWYSARWWMWIKGSNVSVLGVMMVGGIEAAHEGMRNFFTYFVVNSTGHWWHSARWWRWIE